jgi:hypothetical protein
LAGAPDLKRSSRYGAFQGTASLPISVPDTVGEAEEIVDEGPSRVYQIRPPALLEIDMKCFRERTPRALTQVLHESVGSP